MTNSHSRLRLSAMRGARAEIGLGVLCLFLFFWRLGSVPLIDYDEALYVTCARQMVVRGDWVTPRLNTRQPERPGVTAIAFFEKPILVYWAAAGAMRLLGPVMWAARLPVALASFLTTWLVYAAGRRWFTRRAGLLAALIYATAPMTLLDARQMTTDALLVLWLTGALLCFQAVQEKGERRKEKGEKSLLLSAFPKTINTAARNKAARDDTSLSPFSFLLSPSLFWLCCALAVLTKGAVGLLLPFLVIGVSSLRGSVYVTLRPRLHLGLRPGAWRVLKTSIGRIRAGRGLLLAALIAAPWHLLIAQRADLDAQGRTWIQEYILRQHIGRFRGLDAVHNQPLPTFILYFLIGFFPWACFVPAAFRGEKSTGERRKEKGERGARLHQSAASGVVNEEEDAATSRQEADVDNAAFLLSPFSFCLTWFWTIFVFFSLGAAKLPTYITPAYPAAALLVGRWLDRALHTRRGAGLAAAQDVSKDEQEANDTWAEDDSMAHSLRRGASGASGVGVALLIAALILPSRVPANVPLPDALFRFARHVALLFTLGSGMGLLCFWRAERDSRLRMAGVATLAGMMTLLIGLAATEGYAVAGDYVMRPYQQLAEAAQTDQQTGIPVVFYSISPRRPSMLFYAGYSPLEHKEPGLLPFLAPTLTLAQRYADVVTPGKAYANLLLPEIQAVPGATVRILQRRGFGDGWILARIFVPPSYAPPATQTRTVAPR